MTREELRRNCNFDPAKVEANDPSTFIDRCFQHQRGVFEALELADDLTPERRCQVIRHELIHLLVPKADHVAEDQKAIFHRVGTSPVITIADVTHLEHFTDFER
jgi:hypothetical protein